jgi:hypothetical protein
MIMHFSVWIHSCLVRSVIYTPVFWGMAPCSLVGGTSVLEEPTASAGHGMNCLVFIYTVRIHQKVKES